MRVGNQVEDANGNTVRAPSSKSYSWKRPDSGCRAGNQRLSPGYARKDSATTRAPAQRKDPKGRKHYAAAVARPSLVPNKSCNSSTYILALSRREK